VPIEEYLHGKPLIGTFKQPPASPPASGPLTFQGIHYEVDSYTLGAFRRVDCGSPYCASPSASLSALSCQRVRLATHAAIVDRVATGLMLSGHNIYSNQRLFVSQAYDYVHLPVFMFKAITRLSEPTGWKVSPRLPRRSSPMAAR